MRIRTSRGTYRSSATLERALDLLVDEVARRIIDADEGRHPPAKAEVSGLPGDGVAKLHPARADPTDHPFAGACHRGGVRLDLQREIKTRCGGAAMAVMISKRVTLRLYGQTESSSVVHQDVQRSDQQVRRGQHLQDRYGGPAGHLGRCPGPSGNDGSNFSTKSRDQVSRAIHADAEFGTKCPRRSVACGQTSARHPPAEHGRDHPWFTCRSWPAAPRHPRGRGPVTGAVRCVARRRTGQGHPRPWGRGRTPAPGGGGRRRSVRSRTSGTSRPCP
ncbi:hypothetical protein SAMN05660733_05490 [Lentzea albidocapillata]|uniref:Uncharacterized protein n=1 Tax=Lentzea albidocapillata TaxID=40571 RepID=A0A1W2FBN0_9PSEU|nr:hypothetical protein SAMN05660733_05490 [Lentzea albidocapillata]